MVFCDWCNKELNPAEKVWAASHKLGHHLCHGCSMKEAKILHRKVAGG